MMSKITALTKQKRNPNRVNVFIDNEFAFGLAAITAVRLKVGQTLTTEEIESIQKEDQFENAKQAAIHFIEYRPRSISEVRQRLQRNGFSEEIIDKTIARLEELKLLNDIDFAKYWIEQRETFKPRSQMALRQELLQKGVNRTIIEDIIQEIDEEAAARRAAQKQIHRWQKLPEEQFKHKAIAFLQRRGFQYSIAKETTEALWAELTTEQ